MKKSNQISRRDFIKGAAAGAAGLATMSLLGACTSSNETQAETITTQETDSTTLEASNSTTEQGTSASAEGSSAVLNMEVPDFFTAPETIPESECSEVVETDVVIVGAGNAGCAAACSCVENDLKTIVLEKLDTVQGRGGGIGLANTKFTEELSQSTGQDLTVNIEEAQHRWVRTCGSRVNEALVSMWFNYSPEAGNWLIDKCAEYGVYPDSFRAYAPNAIIPESYSYHQFHTTDDTPEFPDECSYFAATSVLYVDSKDEEKYGEYAAKYYFNTKAEQLVKDGDRITGVVATNEAGEYVMYKAAKGVVLASGGIHDDEEMVDYYCDHYVHRVLECQNTPVGYSTGDGHKMGLWAGAAMQEGAFPLMLHPQAGGMFHGAFPFLNMEGERFCNEGTWVQGKSMNVMNQTDYIGWSIFDKNYGEYNVQTLKDGIGGGMFWDSMGGDVGDEFLPEDVETIVESELAADNGKVYRADTLEELAELIGIDPDKMAASIKRYNDMVAAGQDIDFYKQKEFLFPVEEAPFYASKVGVALLAIVGGLKINTDLQVLDNKKQPIAGLYATGNCSGDLYQIDYPINMAGNSNGRCLIWGYLMGQKLKEA